MTNSKTYGCEECRNETQGSLQFVDSKENNYLGGKAYDTVKANAKKPGRKPGGPRSRRAIPKKID